MRNHDTNACFYKENENKTERKNEIFHHPNNKRLGSSRKQTLCTRSQVVLIITSERGRTKNKRVVKN